MDLERKYTICFSKLFDNIKVEFGKSIGFREADEVSSGELAFRDAISSLPCPVSIVRLTIDVKKYKEAENSVYHLIRYDFFNFGEYSIRYYGEVDLDEIVLLHGAIRIERASKSPLLNFREELTIIPNTG